MKKIIYLSCKSTHSGGYLANFNPENCKDILEIAYESVIEGNAKVRKLVNTEPSLFSKNTLKSLLLNNATIDIFRTKVLTSEKTKHRVKFFETYRMTFALVDNKFFLCFKALGKDNTIEGMKTKRFADIIEGKPFSISKKMNAELAKLSLKGLPPILFVGFKKTTDYIDFINLQYYFDGDISLEYGIRQEIVADPKDIIRPRNNNNDDQYRSLVI